MAYGVDAMIPVEIGEPTLQRCMFDIHLNEESMLTNLNLIQELQDHV